MDQRPIPPAALADENAVEMLRVWIGQGKLHCSLKIGMYQDRNIDECTAWGTILADAARHISMALGSEYGEDQQQALEKILTTFNAELAQPTSEASGEFV